MQINQDIKTLWQYLKKYKKKVYFLAFLAVIASVISAVIPYIYGRLVDFAVDKSIKIDSILIMIGAWLVLTLISNWAGRFVDREGIDVGVRSSNDLLIDICDHILHLPIGFHKDKRMGEVLQRATRASDFFERIVEETLFSLAPGLLRVIIALSILTYVEWRLSAALLIIIAFYLFAVFLKVKPIVEIQKKVNKAWERSYGDIYNSTLNIQTVKSSLSEKMERRKNARNLDSAARVQRLLMKAWMNMDAWQQTITGFGFVAIFALGIFLLRLNVVSAGELVMFVGYTALIYQPLAQLTHNYRMLKRGMAIIDRALGLFEVAPEKYQEGIELKNVRGEVVFDNVSFSYKKKQAVLKNINFRARAGEVIALVGESGVGKTTLTDLISRYISPTRGRVLVDGYDIEKVSLQSLRRIIALVPQEISLFNDTIKNNIAYGNPAVSMKEIIKVSKAANAHEFIEKFTKKYNQLVGERGIKLSTGQKQRVAIARALIRNPKILILDEATSSLDSVSEKLVQQALKRLIKGRTTFVIAHRLSTISHADKILVIEKGKIVESGTHNELLRVKDGIYRKFYFMQSLLNEEKKWQRQ
jgi:ABC-type multidrug transport system fused ATPase/permease subunit